MKVDGESGGVAVEQPPAPEQPTRAEDQTAQEWLRAASFKEILGSDASHKSLFVLVEHSSGEKGVLLLNKSPFSEQAEDISAIVRSAELTEILKNDIFGNYDIIIPSNLNVVKSQLIYPANEKVIAKYRQEEKFVIRETAEDYRTITVEYIEKYQMDLKWVYNVLSKNKEAERIIYEDPDLHNGFILAPDIKWDGVALENLYVLAMIHRRGVRSIRLKYDAPASTTLSAVLLDDVINNLQLVPDYYQKATLTFTRKASDKLLEMFREAGRCEK
ncbi:scavenger mRNA decapping enzyme [Ancylostoma caninum]|uniref:m7GpppX diphosphatase n=1 Tax=Ancylostoma caninum TaxID=29170 RepID=A0A368H5W7_ANCCA|nr:scavenger mRNA decapping enzyme [Ancylostoma caninum]